MTRNESLDAMCDPLIFPLMYYDGTYGYGPGIRRADPTSGSRILRDDVSPVEFYRHRLQNRDADVNGPIERDAALANGRLTQEYICSSALKIQQLRKIN